MYFERANEADYTCPPDQERFAFVDTWTGGVMGYCYLVQKNGSLRITKYLNFQATVGYIITT